MIGQSEGPTAGAVDVATLPPFTGMRSVCPECGARSPGNRVHYCRGCRKAVGGEHFHRICPRGHEWLER